MSSFDPRYREGSTAGSLAVTLQGISRAIGALLQDKGQAHGLSRAQLRALLFLAHARPAVHTIGGLAQRLGCTSATASVVADALERKGFAVRVPRPQNRRIITLKLTDDGAAMVAQVDDSLSELETVVRELSQEEQEAALRATTTIVRGLADRGRVTVYEMCRNCGAFRPATHGSDLTGSHHCELMDVPLTEADSTAECPDCVARKEGLV